MPSDPTQTWDKFVENAPKTDLRARKSLYALPKDAFSPLKVKTRFYKPSSDDMLYEYGEAKPLMDSEMIDRGHWTPLIKKTSETYEKVRWQSPEEVPHYGDKFLIERADKASKELAPEYKRYQYKVAPKSSFRLTDAMKKLPNNKHLYESIAKEKHYSKIHKGPTLRESPTFEGESSDEPEETAAEEIAKAVADLNVGRFERTQQYLKALLDMIHETPTDEKTILAGFMKADELYGMPGAVEAVKIYRQYEGAEGSELSRISGTSEGSKATGAAASAAAAAASSATPLVGASEDPGFE